MKQHHSLSLQLRHLCLASCVVSMLAFSSYQPVVNTRHGIIRQSENDSVSTRCNTQLHGRSRHTLLYHSTIPSSQSSAQYNHNSNNNSNKVQVSIINSNYDILSLADMRYQEWMANDPNPPSLHNFRLATLDIYNERSGDGAVVFLAKMYSHDDSDSIGGVGSSVAKSVGAAELSPIELQNVIITTSHDIGITTNPTNTTNDPNDNHHHFLLQYVTDVVTSSTARRLGIGSTLMTTLETTAWEMGTRCLLLHVENDNMQARRFYERLNYTPVGHGASRLLIDNDGDGVSHVVEIDVDRLELNAGTAGQLLMMKVLSEPNSHSQEEEEKVVDDGGGDLKGGSKRGFGRGTVQRKRMRSR